MGSIILPQHNTVQLPKSISNVCDQLSLLYRVHNNKSKSQKMVEIYWDFLANKEVLTLYPKLFTNDESFIFNALGYCSIYQGYCGTNAPIYENPRHTKNVDPICYGYEFDRDLDLVSNRLNKR